MTSKIQEKMDLGGYRKRKVTLVLERVLVSGIRPDRGYSLGKLAMGSRPNCGKVQSYTAQKYAIASVPSSKYISESQHDRVS